MSASVEEDRRSSAGVQPAGLLVGLLIMFGGTAYPLVMANASGKVDHALASLLFWAMSAGFVRGFGLIPNARLLRWLLSGWACLASLLLAAVVWFGP